MWYLTEDRALIQQTVKEFVESDVRPHVMEHERDDSFPLEEFKRAGELGLLGINLPEEYGGMGGDWTTLAVAMEEISKVSPVLCVAMGAHSQLAAGLIASLGTDEQKKRWLAPAATGEIVLSCGQTEAVGGADQIEYTTSARLDGDEWVINGGKVLVSNIGVADWYVILTVTGEVDPVTKSGFSAMMIPKDAPGLTVGAWEHKLGWHGSATGSLELNDVRVPKDHLLGPEGQSLMALFMSATAEFMTCGPMGLGIAEGAYEMALDYAMTRIQRGESLYDQFQTVRFRLAEMWMDIETLRGLVYQVHAMKDQGDLCLAEGRMLKCKGYEISERVARNAIQVYGGLGVIRDVGLERYWRDAKVLAIGGASVEYLTETIAQLNRKTALTAR